MGTLIFDFNDQLYWVYLLFLTLMTVVGVIVLVMWIRFIFLLLMGKMSEFPIINRVLYATVPLIIGVVLVFFCGHNAWAFGDFYMDWFREDYSQVSGPLEDVTITEGGYRDESLMDVTFTVSGIEFPCAYGPEEIGYFEEGREMTIQYGWVGEDLVIYRIYAAERED